MLTLISPNHHMPCLESWPVFADVFERRVVPKISLVQEIAIHNLALLLIDHLVDRSIGHSILCWTKLDCYLLLFIDIK